MNRERCFSSNSLKSFTDINDYQLRTIDRLIRLQSSDHSLLINLHKREGSIRQGYCLYRICAIKQWCVLYQLSEMRVNTKKTPEKVIHYQKSNHYYQTSDCNPSQKSKSNLASIPFNKKLSTKTSQEERVRSKSKKSTYKPQPIFTKTSNEKRRLTSKSNQKIPVKVALPKKLCVDSKYDQLLARLTELEQTNLSLCKEFTNTFIDIEKEIKKVNHKIGGITDDVAGIKIELKENQQDIGVLIELMSQEPNISLEVNPNQLTRNVSTSETSLKRKTSTKKTK